MSEKTWEVVEESIEQGQYIVRIDFNDSEGHSDTCYYGPFSIEDANNFCQDYSADDTEIDDAFVIFLNRAIQTKE